MRARPTLHDVEQALAGPSTIRGRVLRSNVCPSCGGKPKRYRKVFVVSETVDGLLAYCQKCNADHRTLSEALGIALGPYRRVVIPDDQPPDEGPFHADEEVLRRVRRGQFTVIPGVDWGDDWIGELARLGAEHLVSARERVPRLRHDPWEPPTSQRFLLRHFRKLGRPLGSDNVALVRQRLIEAFATVRHRVGREDADGHRIKLVILKLRCPHNRSSGATNPSRNSTNPDHSAVSRSSGGRQRRDQGLPTVLLDQIRLVVHPHAPPIEVVEASEHEWIDVASFRLLGAAA